MRLSEQLHRSLDEGRLPKSKVEADSSIERLTGHLMSAEDKLKRYKREKWQAEQQIGTLEARIKHYKARIKELVVARKKL